MGEVCEKNSEELISGNLKQNLEMLIDCGRLQEAAEIIELYEKLIRNDIEIVSMKAVIAIMQKDFDTALRILHEGLILDSGNYDILYNLGYVYEMTGQGGLAEELYKRAFVCRANTGLKLSESPNELHENAKRLKNTRIYVWCLANMATGGTELLHQLCHKLNELGYDAWMFYYGIKEDQCPVHDRYIKYNNRYVTSVCDDKNQIMIIPEVIVNNIIFGLKETRKIIWWLSVDFFLTSAKNNGIMEKEWINKLKENNMIHFAQSQYAVDYLKKAGVDEDKIHRLSDYLNEEFIKKSSALRENKYRKPYILFNPKKGYDFTSKLIEHSPELKLNWLPLINYTPEEMRMIMNQSMVYIDFGFHPGKDRIPREAAICGCCVIVGKSGAAQNPIDISIPEEFKIEKREENIEIIIDKIKYLLAHYEEEIDKFQTYRNIILSEEERFESDLCHCLEYLGSRVTC